MFDGLNRNQINAMSYLMSEDGGRIPLTANCFSICTLIRNELSIFRPWISIHPQNSLHSSGPFQDAWGR
jgi:hypothetical protein